MEKKNTSSFSSSNSKNKVTSSIAELFGPNDSSSYSQNSPSSANSSSSIFGSVFGPPSMGRGRDSTSHGNFKHGGPDNGAKNSKGENSKNSYYEQETIDQPCYYSSSIYYGGQEVYSPTTRPSESQLPFKKDEQDDDSNSASRGNWWQGSLYY